MGSEIKNKKSETNQTSFGKGIFLKLKNYLDTSRIGDLLIGKGWINEGQLQLALQAQRVHYRPLGRILVDYDMISRRQLAGIMCRQMMLRSVVGVLFLAFSMAGFAQKKVRAEYIKDIRPEVRLSVQKNFNELASYPKLFGSAEKKSYNLKPFTKWTSMFERFDSAMDKADARNSIEAMKVTLQGYQSYSIKEMARRVNNMMNEKRYISDADNWGKSDYWATPVEFMERGGDCEDYAIAKYTALRALGVPEERLRLAIVHDNLKNIPHAVLVVYTEQGPFILDNQTRQMAAADEPGRYRPIFSINRTAWWLHTAPNADTRLASVN